MGNIRAVVAVCLALVLAGCVARGATAGASSNRAVVDTARTSEVLDAVREGVRVALTVESSTLRNRDERIAPYVTAAGARDINSMLATDLTDAKTIPLSVEITIAEAAVNELVGDRASVAVFGAKVREDETRFAEQHSLLIGTKRVDGTWRIDSVKDSVSATDMPRAGTPTDPNEAERDSAIAAARTIAATLIAYDEKDPEGSVARWLSVSTGPLADRRRAIPSEELETYGTKRVDPDASFGAATAVEKGRATVLLAMAASNVDDVAARPYEHLCWISLTRDQTGKWKARDFRDVDTLGTR